MNTASDPSPQTVTLLRRLVSSLALLFRPFVKRLPADSRHESGAPLQLAGNPPGTVALSAVPPATLTQMRRLVYRSLACCEISGIEQIFCDSQSHNSRSGITGILFVSGPRFYQCIEGEHEAVDILYERIKKDSRHCMVELLDDRSSDGRLFPYWSMGSLLGYEAVIRSVTPLLDSADGLQIRVGLEMLALSIAHQDVRAMDGAQATRMLQDAPDQNVQSALANDAGKTNTWLSLVAENMYLKAQLARAEAGRREFFSAISHEMRTPMSGMLSAADLLCHPKLNAAMLERQRSALRSSSDRFAKTLNDIFTLHRIESGDQLPSLHRVNLHEQVQWACERARHEDVRLTVELSDAEMAQCEVDPSLLQTVLDNLIANAIKRSHCGQVGVSLKILAESGDRLWWRCGIRDHGSHVSMDRLLTLFQPFSAGLDQGGGYVEDSGLDLALAGAIVKLLNGRMGAHNEADGGLTVWFTLGVEKVGQDATAIREPSVQGCA